MPDGWKRRLRRYARKQGWLQGVFVNRLPAQSQGRGYFRLSSRQLQRASRISEERALPLDRMQCILANNTKFAQLFQMCIGC